VTRASHARLSPFLARVTRPATGWFQIGPVTVAPLTSFLGREQELAELARLLAEARLVTLCGTGGVGKTRLALELADGVLARFADGAWLADLAGISDPGLVPTAVMAAVGVRQEGGVPAVEALVYRLRSAELLLVLDNCEHLLDACAQLAEVLLRAAPGLRVLATSREALALPARSPFRCGPWHCRRTRSVTRP
jgi:Novel STAND NTPase 1